MSQNRLNLNFKLESMEERTDFINDYLERITFKPTSAELDLMAKYILWGKNSKTGLNGPQEGIELETRSKTWDPARLESLDSLLEMPSFSETSLHRLGEVPTYIPREKFSRSRARKNAPPHLLAVLETLWRNIDETELITNLYELAHGKRTLPPREKLVARIESDRLPLLRARAAALNPYSYLKLRHNLVEMRREQYTLKDEYAPAAPLLDAPSSSILPLSIGAEISVLPIGIPDSANTTLSQKIFNPDRFPIPKDFTQDELRQISQILWERPVPSKRYFDFSNPDHLYELYKFWNDLVEAESEAPPDSTLPLFLRAASMYRTLAILSPMEEDILDFKIQKLSNEHIADLINQKYNKSYRPNYISTLYCKKCLVKIAETANRHREVLENIFFPENFKTCKDCGATLLMDEKNFMRRGRSSTGFSPRCKRCEKILRDRRK